MIKLTAIENQSLTNAFAVVGAEVDRAIDRARAASPDLDREIAAFTRGGDVSQLQATFTMRPPTFQVAIVRKVGDEVEEMLLCEHCGDSGPGALRPVTH